jgi:hypothetical protein
MNFSKSFSSRATISLTHHFSLYLLFKTLVLTMQVQPNDLRPSVVQPLLESKVMLPQWKQQKARMPNQKWYRDDLL